MPVERTRVENRSGHVDVHHDLVQDHLQLPEEASSWSSSSTVALDGSACVIAMSNALTCAARSSTSSLLDWCCCSGVPWPML